MNSKSKKENDVILNWKYKDCILLGSKTKDENLDIYFEYNKKNNQYEQKQRKKEDIFLDKNSESEQIQRLFDSKVFVNWKRYTKDGEQEVKEIKRNLDGTIKENLIIKGENLIVLNSLKKQFAGKVKLIYIDPPYNTGNDGFKYNDNFNHSTWLTFMKNRLEVARELLRDDGVIFCSINHIELAYVSILMDEIFGKNNKLPIITLKAGTTASYRSINDCPVNVTEYVIAYSLKKSFKPNTIYREAGYSEDYSHFIENIDNKSNNWKLIKLTDYIHKKNGCNSWREYKVKFGDNWKVKRFEELTDFAFKNKSRVVSLNTLQKPSKLIQEAIDKSKVNRDKVIEVPRKEKTSIYCFNGRTLAFFDSKFRMVEGSNVPAEVLTNIWNDISFLGIGPEGGVTLEKGKKPEYLLKTIIELSTKKGDLVLDYHLGTGTTCAVAHKMNRQYIGIEQLDYGENDSVIRLKNVINGDKTGISDYEDINWKGGGDFIYFELAKWNETTKEKILSCESFEELLNFFDEMYEKYFLNYNFKIKKFREKIIQEKEFKALNLEEQKKMFIAMIDNNPIYVNRTEMVDKKFGINEKDQELTNLFYNNEE